MRTRGSKEFESKRVPDIGGLETASFSASSFSARFSSARSYAVRRSGRAAFCLLFLGVALSGGWLAWKYSHHPARRTFSIGINQFPPYTILSPDGSFTGIAVEVLNEAARRGRVSLKWVRVEATPDRALTSKLVDLWPIVATTPERTRVFHITRPWTQNNYCLLSRKESNLAFGGGLAGQKVAYPSYPLATAMAHKFLASSDLRPSRNPDEVIHAVCNGEVQAGFLEARVLDPVLMERPAGCEKTALNVHFVNGALSEAGIASTREAAVVADALRSQIATMITDGTLSGIMDKWASFSPSEARSLSALQQTEKRAQITLYGCFGLLAIASILLWQFNIARKLRKVADRAKLLETDRNVILESLASNETLASLLKRMSQMVERQCPEMVCAISVRQGDFLVLISPSRLPRGLQEFLARVEVGPSGLACATAAFEKRWTVATDLPSSSAWKSWRPQLQASGLQSCWAVPVYSGTGQVVAVVAAYVKSSAHPGRTQTVLLESTAQLMAVVLERRRMDEQLRHLACHDSLTGLPNRALLSERLQETLSKGKNFALLCIDLDRFKQINDTLGHSIGDLFLRKVSELIRSVLRPGDMLARMGGDEFIVLLQDAASGETAERLAERLLEVVHTPVLVNGTHLFGSASIGISFYPQHGSTAEDLQRNADSAMYQAKQAGKDRYKVFAWEMSRVAGESLAMQHDLRVALEHEQFELHYQPQFSVTGELVGAEALIRLRHPRFGLIFPGRFITCAEESGLITPIGQWVLREACRQLAEWRRQGVQVVRTAINVSAIQLAQPDFADAVQAALQTHAIPASLLEIELTESAVMHSMEESMFQMSKLRKLGVRLAIDDFGTGYSSLSYLQKLPVNAVKIDRSFIRDDQQSGRAIPLVQAIVAAAGSLGLEVVAEGVETKSQHRAVCAAGCDIVQGFFLSKPLSAPDIEALLRADLVSAPTARLEPEAAVA